MAREYILSGFGLAGIRPLIYKQAQGQGLDQPQKNYTIGDKQDSSLNRSYPDQEAPEVDLLSIESDNQPIISILGTPIISDLLLRDPETGRGLYFDTVLFDIALPKNIVRTSIPGRNGTIKEYINDGDYEINIKGAMVHPVKGQYPIDQVAEFYALMQMPRALVVVSELLQLAGIDSIVVEGFACPQRAGFTNVQLFEITALSEIPIEFLDNDQIDQ